LPQIGSVFTKKEFCFVPYDINETLQRHWILKWLASASGIVFCVFLYLAFNANSTFNNSLDHYNQLSLNLSKQSNVVKLTDNKQLQKNINYLDFLHQHFSENFFKTIKRYHNVLKSGTIDHLKWSNTDSGVEFEFKVKQHFPDLSSLRAYSKSFYSAIQQFDTNRTLDTQDKTNYNKIIFEVMLKKTKKQPQQVQQYDDIGLAP
jgi:hypothetical protein